MEFSSDWSLRFPVALDSLYFFLLSLLSYCSRPQLATPDTAGGIASAGSRFAVKDLPANCCVVPAACCSFHPVTRSAALVKGHETETLLDLMLQVRPWSVSQLTHPVSLGVLLTLLTLGQDAKSCPSGLGPLEFTEAP